MSEDTQIKASAEYNAPLRRFIKRKNNNGDSTTKTVITNTNKWQSRLQQAFTRQSDDRSKCRSSCEGRDRSTTDDNSQPQRKRRSRKSQSPRHDTAGNANFKTRLKGMCRCGAAAEAPYFERCEDCFAEDSERWSGHDQSATIHF